jgi:predicted TIM-barrel fold metal-dependent hydrolase
LDERWAAVAQVWTDVRTTGYGRAVLLAARDLFGISDINETTYRELSERIASSNHSGWYQYVLKERANIELAILQSLEEFDTTPLNKIDRWFFAPVVCMNDFVVPCSRVDLQGLERKTDVSIHSLDHLLDAMDASFERAVAAGVAGVKITVALRRSLHFEKVARADAERLLNRLFLYPVDLIAGIQQPPVSWNEVKPLQDYLMHQVIQRAIECRLPIQIHTGFQVGNGNFLDNANPIHLTNLLIEYSEARFDLFHAGYPYQGIMAVLGKNFPNVYVDLCWVHIISPWVARHTLHEWIETVPANKIFAFGGDYTFVEGAYAHARMARANVALVLTEKIEMGYMTEEEGVELARKLLRDNAARFFHLPVQDT